MPAAEAAPMIAEGSQRFRARYRQVGELGQTAFRSAQRSATGLCGLFRSPAPSTGGKRGDNPANSRRRLRTWPKLRPGSSLCASPKTSPLASLVGSHQPRPAWLTMRISPLPRRYFRLSLVLSFRSSFQHGGVCSNTTAQWTFSRNPRFRGRVGSYPLLALGRRSWAVWPWACLRPCPARKPRDRRATRARGSLRRTLVARPALAVAISAPSLLTRRWAKAARTENASQKQRRSAGQTPRHVREISSH